VYEEVLAEFRPLI